jgi:hypothetical protein
MAVVVRRNWQAGAAALATLVSVLGLLAAPAARASQSGQPRPVVSTWQREMLRPQTAGQASFAPIPARSLWRPGGLAHGGLPRVTRPLHASARGGWTVQPTPNPATERNALPLADSCSAAGACTAVGDYVNPAGVTVTLAERLKNSSWQVQRTPAITNAADSLFRGVSCTSAKSCVAVGYYFNQSGVVIPLAESWNGTTWRAQTGPQAPKPVGQDSGFFAVSCTSATACTAVGTYDENATTALALAERWNGKSWSVESTPNTVGDVASTLFGVSCSGPKACTAAGAAANISGTSTPLAMGWNGSSWTLQTAPAPSGSTGSGFSAVACTTAGACTAAGSYLNSSGTSLNLAERWNGTSWAIQSVPSPAGALDSELVAVSCISATACTAGGDYLSSAAAVRGSRPDSAGPDITLAETWNGSSWTVQATPNPAGTLVDGFLGLSCVTSGACAAVGSYATAADLAGLGLAEARSGTKWKIQSSVSPAGANPSQLTSDSCVTARHCVAVGFYDKSTTVTDTLAETWNGSRWRIEATPNPAGQTASAFNAISCASARSCVAVGGTVKGSGNEAPMAETWNGSKWTVRKMPAPAHNAGVSVNGVSCTAAGACTAAGFYDTHSGAEVALAERWNGAKWTIQKLPSVAKLTLFNSVSCTSARACIAVGFLNKTGKGDAQPFAEAWNGKSWKAQHVPLPKGAPGGAFSGISCSAAKDCTATGAGFAANGKPLAERWNGTKWAAQATVAPPNFETSTSEVALIGVSCSAARACTAVGSYTPNNEPETFGEGWNGAKWSLQATYAPIVSEGSILGGVSCSAPKCIAVGAYIAFAGNTATLAESHPA